MWFSEDGFNVVILLKHKLVKNCYLRLFFTKTCINDIIFDDIIEIYFKDKMKYLW